MPNVGWEKGRRLSESFTPKISGRVTAAILRFAESRGLNAAELCDGLPASRAQLAAERGWVDWSIGQLLWERLAAATDNRDIAAEVGLFAVKNNLLGAVGTIFRLFGSMPRALQRTEIITRYFSNFHEIKTARLGAASASLELHAAQVGPAAYHDINFVRGLLAGLPLLWDQPMAQVGILQYELSAAACSPIDGRTYEIAADGEVFSVAPAEPAERRREGRLEPDGSFALNGVTYGATGTLFHVAWEKRSSRWLLKGVFPNQDALTGTVAGLEKDLRDMEAMHAQLQHVSANLQQMVADRTAELEKANRGLAEMAAKLERRSRLRGEFLADLSHELRTLITSVAGFADLLSSEIYGALSQRQRDACERISLNARVLLRIINDLLDLSQLQAGKMTATREAVPVREMLEETLATVAPLAADKKLELRLEIDPETPVRLFTDQAKLQNVLLNLLANAVKCSDRGRITLRAASADPAFVSFSIEDAGGGFAESDLPLLFEEFARVGRAGHQAAEIGLGMNITKKLVDLLRGSIEVGSRPGIGTVFTVSLPTRPAGAPETAPEENPPYLDAGRNLRTVVVADSNLEDAHFLRLSLEAEGLRAEVCDDGRAVLSAIDSSAADLLLIDPLMRFQDGWHTLRELRADARFAKLPVILVSENVQADLAEAYEVVRSFAKPYDVREVVREALRQLRLTGPAAPS